MDDEAPLAAAPRRVPRYALQTVSYSAPEFANHEQDVIRQSFATGNHTWMKEAIPVELGPDTVNLLRRQRMERNRLMEMMPQPHSKMTQCIGGGYYQEFEYIPDEYGSRVDHDQSKRKGSLDAREKISNHDWRYVSQERRLKYEAMIVDPRNKETYPYLGGSKEAEEEAAKQMQRGAAGPPSERNGSWSQDRGSGPVPSEASFLAGRGKGLEDNSKGSRMMLPTIVLRLQKRLEADWEGTTVVVSATDQDLIQIAFHMDTVDSERGVVAYMSVLSRDADLLGSMGLRKVSQLWGMKRDFSAELGSVAEEPREAENQEHSWMFFLLMPKWVRMRATDAYYTFYPRAQGSAFRMSTAGSSVLLSLGTSSVNEADGESRKELYGGSTLSSVRETRNSARGGPSADFGSTGGRAKPAAKVDLAIIEKAVSTLPTIPGAGH